MSWVVRIACIAMMAAPALAQQPLSREGQPPFVIGPQKLPDGALVMRLDGTLDVRPGVRLDMLSPTERLLLRPQLADDSCDAPMQVLREPVRPEVDQGMMHARPYDPGRPTGHVCLLTPRA